MIYIYIFLIYKISIYVLVFGNKQEEQHANTSANYDVELLHHRDAHLEFFKSGEQMMKSFREESLGWELHNNYFLTPEKKKNQTKTNSI